MLIERRKIEVLGNGPSALECSVIGAALGDLAKCFGYRNFAEWANSCQPSSFICQLVGGLHDLGYEIVPMSAGSAERRKAAYEALIQQQTIGSGQELAEREPSVAT